jgi:hypothetical protein
MAVDRSMIPPFVVWVGGDFWSLVGGYLTASVHCASRQHERERAHCNPFHLPCSCNESPGRRFVHRTGMRGVETLRGSACARLKGLRHATHSVGLVDGWQMSVVGRFFDPGSGEIIA